MKNYESLSREELLLLRTELEAKYEAYKILQIDLDLGRGKRCQESRSAIHGKIYHCLLFFFHKDVKS